MKDDYLFLLDNHETIRAGELFENAAPAKPRIRLVTAVSAMLLTVLIVILSVAYAEGALVTWQGQEDEDSLHFSLSYPEDRLLVRIDGGGYDCNLTAKVSAGRKASQTAMVYPVTSSGGRCDGLLAGKVELDTVDASQRDLKEAARVVLRIIDSKGVTRHKLRLSRLGDS
jgi:hypothetical protein